MKRYDPMDPAKVTQRCCVANFTVTVQAIAVGQSTNKEGVKGWSRTTAFDVVASFAGPADAEDCDCSCCEYRQFRKGKASLTEKGVPSTDDFDAFTQDLARQIRPYGHRKGAPNDKKDEYSGPNRETGCNYKGHDEAGFTFMEPGAAYSYDRVFLGRIYDTCNSGHLVAEAKWRIKDGPAVAPPLPLPPQGQ